MKTENQQTGDMPAEEFRRYGHKLIDWIADYLQFTNEVPVLPDMTPGTIKSMLPGNPPEEGENMEAILADVDKIIMPGMTHWNHPRFMAYFNSTGSGPGILAELLSGAFNINGMLWKSCPSATELEQVMIDWFRQLVGLPDNYWGIIYEGGSSSTMHAIAAARENLENLDFRTKGMSGRPDTGKIRLYMSEQAHSSVEKGALMLGVGLENICKIPVDKDFRMNSEALKNAIADDRRKGFIPFCVVATVGTTSTTSIDPIDKIADICESEKIWLHVDAAHAGIAAIVPEMRFILNGCQRADSILINPHKWMFVPIDLSVFFTRNPGVLKKAFSITPEYLKTPEGTSVTNYMDYGITLGRRFRSLKLWFVIRYFGRSGLIARIREHLRLGNRFAGWIKEHPEFELAAPVPLSTVCFRAVPAKISSEQLNSFNEKLLWNINSTGKVFLTHTKLNDKFIIRLVISGIRTTETDVREVWSLLKMKMEKLKKDFN